MAGLWTLVLLVRSIFFGDSLAFSVPLREQPGQPHHGRAHPGPLGGYRLLLEWVFFRLILILLSPLCFCIFTGETSTSVEFYFTFVQQAQLHAATSGLHWRKSKGLTPTWLLLLYSLLFFSQSQGGESKARDPLLCSTKGEGGVYGGQSVSRFP